MLWQCWIAKRNIQCSSFCWYWYRKHRCPRQFQTLMSCWPIRHFQRMRHPGMLGLAWSRVWQFVKWLPFYATILYVTMVSYAFLGCFMIHWISLTFRHFSFALDFAMKSGKPWFMAPTSMCQSTIALLHVMWECFGWRKRLSRSYPCTWSSAISLLRRGSYPSGMGRTSGHVDTSVQLTGKRNSEISWIFPKSCSFQIPKYFKSETKHLSRSLEAILFGTAEEVSQ